MFQYTVELSYNVMKRTEYSALLLMSVVIAEYCNAMLTVRN
jgi:hypothetical protein